MRLLDARALIYDNVARLVDFPKVAYGDHLYAILSHTWEDEEVLFDDIRLGPQHEIPDEVESDNDSESSRGSDSNWIPSSSASSADEHLEPRDTGSDGDVESDTSWSSTASPTIGRGTHVKAGWTKMLNTCLLAVRDKIRYVWIDTCCIDMSSSAELSEAINSMFEWYRVADRCYAYLSDCHKEYTSNRSCQSTASHLQSAMLQLLRPCRWFTRGWTLQELIAPECLEFFDRGWQLIIDRDDITSVLEAITGIHKTVFIKRQWVHTAYRLQGLLREFSIAQRMHWASSRETTRPEHEAYCLLGIFGDHMPLLYGEGNSAFRRLQEEIIQTTQDDSIFAWEKRKGLKISDSHQHILAASPSSFWGTARYIEHRYRANVYAGNEARLTREGLHIDLEVSKSFLKYDTSYRIAFLDCVFEEPDGDSYAIAFVLSSSKVVELHGRHASDREERVEISLGYACTLADTSASKRLIKLPLSYVHEGPRTPFIISPRRSVVQRPSRGTIRIQQALHNNGYHSYRRVLLVSPWFSWFDRCGDLAFELRVDNYGALAVTDYYSGVHFIIFGLSPDLNGHTLNGIRLTQEICCHIWLVKDVREEASTCIRRTTSSWTERTIESIRSKHNPDAIRELARLEHHMMKLCERASTFATKDYFERSTHRLNSHKSVELGDGMHRSAHIRLCSPASYPAILLKLEFMDYTRSSDDELETDFFHLDEIDEEYQRKLAESRQQASK